MSENNSDLDNRLKVYECTKMEYIEHIKIRNGCLVAYLGIIGVISSGVLSAQQPNPKILLSFPYLSLGIAFIIGQHIMAISSISRFCANELFQEQPPLWESSESLHEFSNIAINLTFWGHLITLILPAVVSIVFNWSLWNGNRLFHGLMVLNITVTLMTIIIVVYASDWRKKPLRIDTT